MEKFKELLFNLLLAGTVTPETARDLYRTVALMKAPEGCTPLAPPPRTSAPPAYSAICNVMDYITDGRQIYAIKAYRDEFGTNLRTAKLACDALRDKLHDAQKRALKRGATDLVD